MTTERQKWKQAFSSPACVVWLAIWILASYMLWRYWKNGTPWPLGTAMPF
jgi:hypothetical protein